MKLDQTIDLMCSSDYKERFAAEYLQVKIRANALKKMLILWDTGRLAFKPICSKDMYVLQLNCMEGYIAALELRAVAEHINLKVFEKE